MPFEIVRNDITRMHVDAIVNAANPGLLGGGGVDGAIHRAAGPELLQACRKLGGCHTGEAKITDGYQLPARYVIHTVGPVWHGGDHDEEKLLSACYRNSLVLADSRHCRTVAFPLISAGAYGYPRDKAMHTALSVISDFLMDHDMTVYLVVFGKSAFLVGKKLFSDIQEYIDEVYEEAHSPKYTQNLRDMLWHTDEKAALDLEQQAIMHAPVLAPEAAEEINAMPDWDTILRQTDEGFSRTLLRMIDERGLKDSDCYKRANVDRKLFSKIRSNPDYRPSKPTVLAFAVALELSYPETQEFLGKAGFILSHTSKQDIVVEYFIRKHIYDICEINQTLFDLDLPILGSSLN